MIYPGAIQVTPKRVSKYQAPQYRRRSQDPAKGTVHTTETRSGSGRAVIRNNPAYYHLLPDPYTKEIFQAIPLDYTAYGLRGSHIATGAKIETNHSGKFHAQISIVGYANQMHLLTEDQLQFLGEIFYTVGEMLGIPNIWDDTFGEMDGLILARHDSPKRKPLPDNWAFAGWQHHQTWYGQDHWDPGKLNVWRLQQIIEVRKGSPIVPPFLDLAELEALEQQYIDQATSLSHTIDQIRQEIAQLKEKLV